MPFTAGYVGFFMADKHVFDPKLSQGSGGFNNILGGDIQIRLAVK